MEKKVYLICLEYFDGWDRQYETQVAHNLQKAQEILKNWVEREEQTTWLAEIDNFDSYEFGDNYFEAICSSFRTTIWIEEKVVQ